MATPKKTKAEQLAEETPMVITDASLEGTARGAAQQEELGAQQNNESSPVPVPVDELAEELPEFVAERVALGISLGEQLPAGEQVLPGSPEDEPVAHKFDQTHYQPGAGTPKEVLAPLVEDLAAELAAEKTRGQMLSEFMNLAGQLGFNFQIRDHALMTDDRTLFLDVGHKSLCVSPVNPAEVYVPDMIVFGDRDTWKLLAKASSEHEGWMKTTKALDLHGTGVLVQTETQQRNVDGTYSLSQALQYVPGVRIEDQIEQDETHPFFGKVVGRVLKRS